MKLWKKQKQSQQILMNKGKLYKRIFFGLLAFLLITIALLMKLALLINVLQMWRLIMN